MALSCPSLKENVMKQFDAVSNTTVRSNVPLMPSITAG